jgi:hypothetical protein
MAQRLVVAWGTRVTSQQGKFFLSVCPHSPLSNYGGLAPEVKRSESEADHVLLILYLSTGYRWESQKESDH